MSRRFPAIPPECDDCPLPDCYPTSPYCPIFKKKLEAKGLSPSPSTPEESGRVGNKKHDGIVPQEFADRTDYQRKYNRTYNQRYRRVMLRGVRLRRCDIEILQAVCEKEGRNLEAEVVTLLEDMAENARAKAQQQEGR